MARAYDIVSRMNHIKEKSTIKIDDDHIYNINTSKSAVLYIRAIHEDKEKEDFELLDDVIKVALGQEALDYINSLDLPMEGLVLIMNVIFAAVEGVELEAVLEAQKKPKK